MIERTALTIALCNCSSQREQELLASHLEALEAISRLRSALQAVLSALDAVDDSDFQKALDEPTRLEEL